MFDTNEIVFKNEGLVCYSVLAVIGLIIPITVALIWKKKLKKGDVLPIFLGAAMFFVFAMTLESLLHMAVLPLVKGNIALSCIYGALAAGLFEETARLFCYKVLMKKKLSAENAVSYGIGHGGFEVLSVLTITSLSVIVMAVMIKSMGTADFIATVSAGNNDIAEQLTAQLENYAAMDVPTAFLAVYERIVAMTFHIGMSVIVMEAVLVKGRMWLYPAAIVLHALLDTPAALYQNKIIPMWLCFVIMTVYTAIISVVAFKRYEFLKNR